MTWDLRCDYRNMDNLEVTWDLRCDYRNMDNLDELNS